MKFTPHILGAVAVVAIAGAVSGATIGDSPVVTRGHSDTMPEAPIVRAGENALLAAQSPPNHYPLKTPQGTIPVEELALRGRLRDRGGELRWAGRESRSGITTGVGDANDVRFAQTNVAAPAAETEIVAAPARHLTRAEAPMALAEPAAVSDMVSPRTTQQASDQGAAEVDAKIVNVSAALAELD